MGMCGGVKWNQYKWAVDDLGSRVVDSTYRATNR